MSDSSFIKRWRKSPLYYIEDVWKLTPQPLKDGVPHDLPANDYRPEDFEEFVMGTHITWQQWLMGRAIERAIAGDAPAWISIVAGHGIGKSTFESWLIYWFLSCWKHSKIGCTAPSAEQMFDVLWAEASLWLQKMPEKMKELYDWQSSYIRIKEDPESWFARARTARKEKPEALAGIHAPNVMLLVDEASGVEDIIFKTAHGALTNKNTLVFMISNGTRTTGYFYDSHQEKQQDDWQQLSFNSLESPIVDQKFVDLIRNKYGEGSDEWRIRVLGQFPDETAIDDKGYMQLIQENDIRFIPEADFLTTGWRKMGVDPSGMGNNKTIVVVRDAFKAEVVYEEKKSTPEGIASLIPDLMKKYEIPADKVYMDIFGVGSDAYQKLALAGHDVIGVDVAKEPDDDDKFINMRAEAYWRTRKWLRTGGDLVNNEGFQDLKSIKYKKTTRGKIQIMPKVEMQKLGLPSPDFADALMLTFCDEDENYNEEIEEVEEIFAGRLS